MNCREVEEKLASYVDGVADARCAPRSRRISRRATPAAQLAHAQTVARRCCRRAPRNCRRSRRPDCARASSRTMPSARPTPQAPSRCLGWTGRLTAFAAAAMVVLTLGAVLLPVATIRSTALLAAQLALDHLKCFTIEGDADGAPIAKEQAEATLKQEFDLTVTVPPSLAAGKTRVDGGAPLPVRRRPRRAPDVSARTASRCRCSSSRA